MRGVLLQDDCVLLARALGARNTFLPGGHVGSGENAEDALCRELRDELGIAVRVAGFLGAVEHVWPKECSQNHEINLVFRLRAAEIDGTAALRSLEPHLEFHWIELSKLHDQDLEPHSLVPLIRLLGDGRAAATGHWSSTIPRGAADGS